MLLKLYTTKTKITYRILSRLVGSRWPEINYVRRSGIFRLEHFLLRIQWRGNSLPQKRSPMSLRQPQTDLE